MYFTSDNFYPKYHTLGLNYHLGNKSVRVVEISDRNNRQSINWMIRGLGLRVSGAKKEQVQRKMSLSFSLSAAPKSLHFKYRGKFSAYTEIIRWEGKNAIYAFFTRYVSFIRRLFLIPLLLSDHRRGKKSAHAYCTGERIGEGFNYSAVARL